jgi:hypothetical protein
MTVLLDDGLRILTASGLFVVCRDFITAAVSLQAGPTDFYKTSPENGSKWLDGRLHYNIDVSFAP